jgi:hypothetical protein
VAYETLNGGDWTAEQGGGSYLSNPTSTSAKATSVPCDSTSRYYYRDDGGANIGDFEIQFECVLHAWDDDGDYMGVLQVVTALEQMNKNAGNGIYCAPLRANKRFALGTSTMDLNNNSWGGVAGETVYCTLTRSSGTVTLETYSDAARAVEDEFGGSPMSRTGFSTLLRYVQICGNLDDGTGSDTVTITVQNVELVSGFTTGSTEHALEGTASGTGSGSGGLSVAKAVAGTASGTGSGSGGLTVTKAVAGTASGTGTGSGGLSVTKALEGTSSGTGTGSGSLTVARTLAGTASGTGSGSGTLTTDDVVSLAGTASGTGAGSGGLTVARTLQSTATATGTGSGSLTRSITLGGTGAGTGSGSGALVRAITLAGTATGTGSGSGRLTGGGYCDTWTDDLSLPLCRTRLLLATTDEMQDWLGVDGVSAAIDEIYIAGADAPTRPFAVVSVEPGSFEKRRTAGGARNWFVPRGAVRVVFEADAGEGSHETEAQEFGEDVGGIIDAALDLSGSDDHISIVGVRLASGPARSATDDPDDYYQAVFVLDWSPL